MELFEQFITTLGPIGLLAVVVIFQHEIREWFKSKKRKADEAETESNPFCDPLNGARCPEIKGVAPVLQNMQMDLRDIKTGVTQWRESYATDREDTRKDIEKLFIKTDEHTAELSALNERTKKL